MRVLLYISISRSELARLPWYYYNDADVLLNKYLFNNTKMRFWKTANRTDLHFYKTGTNLLVKGGEYRTVV
jgi:hypothetical protein